MFQSKKIFLSNNELNEYIDNLLELYCQENIVKSKRNVLRGLHMQMKFQQGKYISVLKGKILDVVVDCRKNSKTFGKVFSCILSEKNSKSI